MWDNMKCFFGKHKSFDVIQVLGYQDSERIRCVNCGKEFVLNHQLRSMIPWNVKVEKFYTSIGNNSISSKFANEK